MLPCREPDDPALVCFVCFFWGGEGQHQVKCMVYLVFRFGELPLGVFLYLLDSELPLFVSAAGCAPPGPAIPVVPGNPVRFAVVERTFREVFELGLELRKPLYVPLQSTFFLVLKSKSMKGFVEQSSLVYTPWWD